jgi:hypothetical protein
MVTPTLSSDDLVVNIALAAGALAMNTQYTLYVSGLAAAPSLGGLPLATPLQVTFTTGGEAPMVMLTSPANGADGWPTDGQPTVTFSEPVMDSNPTSISLVNTMTMKAVTATVALSADGRTATIDPTGALCGVDATHQIQYPTLCEGTHYSIVIGPGLTDTAGMPIAGAPVTAASFTTAVIPPTVVSWMPMMGAANLPANTTCTVTFTSPMAPSTITASTVTLGIPGSTAVTTTLSLDSTQKVLTITPGAPLQAGGNYQLVVNTTVEDYSGIGLVSPFVLNFSTSMIPPAVYMNMITPANGATDVPLSAQVIVQFTESVENVTSTTFTVTPTDNPVDGGSGPVAGTVIPDPTGYYATFAPPSSGYQPTTTYQVVLSDGITNSAGQSLPTFMSSFTTAAAPVIADGGTSDGGTPDGG